MPCINDTFLLHIYTSGVELDAVLNISRNNMKLSSADS